MCARPKNISKVLSYGIRYLTGIPQATISTDGKEILFPFSSITRPRRTKPYNPFQWYENKVSPRIVSACIGSKINLLYKKSDPIRFHTLFSALYRDKYDNYNGILAWVRAFGLPKKALHQWADSHSKKYEKGQVVVPISDIIYYVELFHLAMMLNINRQLLKDNPNHTTARQALVDLLVNDIDSKKPFIIYDDNVAFQLNKALREGVMSKADVAHHVDIYKNVKKELFAQNPLQFASIALKKLINISQVRPEFDVAPNYEPFITWICEDPISAMLLMLAFDAKDNKYLRQCIAPRCGRIFEASRASRQYCSDSCKIRAKVTRFRQKPRPPKAPVPAQNQIQVSAKQLNPGASKKQPII